ncbi:MAG: NAD+ synthase [Gammaproteobacteria bacterium]
MTLRIVLAQTNLLVGDIDGNVGQVIDLARSARREQGARIVVFPELAITGYPPEDLLLRASLGPRVDAAVGRLCAFTQDEGVVLVLGLPRPVAGGLQNAAVVMANGRVLGWYAKQHLPNYRVFDEVRYFQPGNAPLVVDVDGTRVAIAICEDVWFAAPALQAKTAGAEVLLALNASPFHVGKQAEREQVVRSRVQETGLPVAYVNLVGGQDELVFDGGSFAINRAGEVVARAPHCVPAALALDFVDGDFPDGECVDMPAEDVALYDALVLGVRDYVGKNRFHGALLGLSGGIDSALTLAIAVDALGADRVQAVMMPFRYTAQMSIDDARAEAEALGVRFHVIPIEPMFDAFMAQLAPVFSGTQRDTTEENLQSRCRGVLLMAMSNKQRAIVLTTGNKSEMAVGYATLYGDMAGGFGVLKDVLKTAVYRLSDYRNALARQRGEQPPIPQRVIDRPPSAELAPDQKDSDSLPDYPVLDAILRHYVEDDESAEQVIARGFDKDTVYRVVRLVDLNEYKRRQSAVGPRVTKRGFGKDRRYPITNGWKPGI